ncbi:MAG: tetratricopeptide repeat protein [Deltaproteobacteria bacterium]|nr:tetratricopeptide repeat protein [Deltaproteobacteria bacterium]
MKKKYTYLIVIFLIVASCAAFGRIAGNHFINFDDPGYVTKNYNVQSGFNPESIRWAFTTTYFSYWHPLTWISHMLDWRLFGENATGHHLVSLFLHIGAVIFLFLFLNKTTNNIWPSAFAAALFALHPLRVESVAWASERKDVLSMFFGMTALYAYAFYIESSKLSRYFLCLILFALSLMSKPMLVTLPFALLLLDYWPLERWTKAPSANSESRFKLTCRLIREKVPFVCLTIAASILTFWAQTKEGAVSSIENLPFTTRAANAFLSYTAYLGKTFWPVDLAVFYPYEFFLPLWKILISGLVLILITAAVIYYAKKLPFLFTGWFWYLGTLIPVIGLVQVGKQAMADRYTYLPSIGIAIMLAWSLPLLSRSENTRKKILFPAAIALLAALAILTWIQCGYWKSSFTLFNQNLRVTKNNQLARNYDGDAFTELGQYQHQRDIEDFNKAIGLNPDAFLAYYNRGTAYAKIGQYKNAIRDYNMAIRIKPDYADAYNNRGLIYGQHGQYQLAIKDFNKVIGLNPNHIKVYNNRGLAYSELGQYQSAIEDFNKAIFLKQDYANAYNNRANVYLKQKNNISGCRDARKACELGDCKILETAKAKGLCQ